MTTTKTPPPAFVKTLPAPVRTMLRRQCGGDWRRVTRDSDGGLVVHNTPQLSEPPAPAPLAPKPQPPAAPPPPSPATIAATTSSVRPGGVKPWHPPGFRSISRDGLMVTPRTKPIARRRTGAPRNAIELIKRLLDMGAQFVRIPEQARAKVFYLGYVLGVVWVADNTPREIIRRDYLRVREAIRVIDAHFTS